MSKKFVKNLVLIICLIIAIFALASFVLAQDLDTGLEYGEQTGLGKADPRIIIARIIQIALGFLGIVAVGLIIYGGWLWMISEGNEEKITKAKNVLKNAIIGLIIIMSSFAIASFIISRFFGVTSGIGPSYGDGGPDGPRGGLGALGSCTVESVYPEPNQTEVPRNISIIVSFKEEVNPATVCEDTNVSGIYCDSGDKILTDERIKIYKSIDDPANFITDVSVVTNDNKTFIFQPANYLGSPSERIWYTVYLSNDIEKISGGGIFNTCRTDFLEWQFEVSSKIDLIPPQVKEVSKGGVSPLPGSTKPRNSIIQINFNEAINPLTISGSADEVKDYIKIVEVTSGNYLEGKFVVSNQYRTVEFISNNQCGVNGCGEKIYCLPSGELRVELKAASLISCSGDGDCVTRSPYNTCNVYCQNEEGENYPLSDIGLLDGVMDVSFNSLDGNRDDDADGPVSFYDENNPNPNMGDSYQWSFLISDEIDLAPPVIESVVPVHSASGISLVDPIVVTFDKLMMSSSLRTGSIIINNGQDDIEHKRINLFNLDEPGNQPGYWIVKKNVPEENPNQTRVEIRHSPMFLEDVEYRAQVGSGVKDINQNCFNPSSGPGCVGSPSCLLWE